MATLFNVKSRRARWCDRAGHMGWGDAVGLFKASLVKQELVWIMGYYFGVAHSEVWKLRGWRPSPVRRHLPPSGPRIAIPFVPSPKTWGFLPCLTYYLYFIYPQLQRVIFSSLLWSEISFSDHKSHTCSLLTFWNTQGNSSPWYLTWLITYCYSPDPRGLSFPAL